MNEDEYLQPVESNLTVSTVGALYWQAHHAAEDSFINGGRTGLAACVFSAAAVESTLNEVFDECRRKGEHFDEVLKLLASLVKILGLDERGERLSTSTKIRFLHRLLVDDSAIMSVRPFQDLTLILEVRNAVVHMRPEHPKFMWHPETPGYVENELVKRVRRASGADYEPDPEDPAFVTLGDILTSPKAAVWAYNTALVAGREIADWVWQHGLDTLVRKTIVDMNPLTTKAT